MRQKTLVICGQYPLPEKSGMDMRTMNFIRFFKMISDVDIAFYKKTSEEYTKNSFFSNEFLVTLKENAPDNFQNTLLRLLKMPVRLPRKPWPVLEYSEDSKYFLLRQIETNNYDYILVRYIINTNILFSLKAIQRKRVIIDFDDILSGSLYKTLFSPNGLHRELLVNLNRKLLLRYERKCLDFGASLFCSQNDKTEITCRHNCNNSFVVPNIYENDDFTKFHFGDGFENTNVLLFVGTLSYQPNKDGITWFIKSIFSHFKKLHPDATLLVAGRNPSDEIKNLCAMRNDIKLYSNVSDVKEYYKKCKAAIVPILSGGGTRIKILEAAAANRPVLSTPTGADGLDFKAEHDLLLFQNADEFCIQYSKLLSGENYQSLVNNARSLLLSTYSKLQFDHTMKNVLSSL
jgi:glycosyltransferase involved in cell wall biosynthesis